MATIKLPFRNDALMYGYGYNDFCAGYQDECKHPDECSTCPSLYHDYYIGTQTFSLNEEMGKTQFYTALEAFKYVYNNLPCEKEDFKEKFMKQYKAEYIDNAKNSGQFNINVNVGIGVLHMLTEDNRNELINNSMGIVISTLFVNEYAIEYRFIDDGFTFAIFKKADIGLAEKWDKIHTQKAPDCKSNFACLKNEMLESYFSEFLKNYLTDFVLDI